MKYLADQARQNRQNPALSMNIFSKCLESGVTKPTKLDYDSLALCKITKLALVGYEYLAHSPLNGLFLCVIFPLMRFMVKLERDTFECASYLDYWSTNPFQLYHPHLVVNGEAPLFNLGAH